MQGSPKVWIFYHFALINNFCNFYNLSLKFATLDYLSSEKWIAKLNLKKVKSLVSNKKNILFSVLQKKINLIRKLFNSKIILKWEQLFSD